MCKLCKCCRSFGNEPHETYRTAIPGHCHYTAQPRDVLIALEFATSRCLTRPTFHHASPRYLTLHPRFPTTDPFLPRPSRSYSYLLLLYIFYSTFCTFLFHFSLVRSSVISPHSPSSSMRPSSHTSERFTKLSTFRTPLLLVYVAVRVCRR